jgi:hypothetical protein
MTHRKQRDLTQVEFSAALQRHGIGPRDFLGYHKVTGTPSGGGLTVCAYNAGSRRRDQLAYLLKMQARELAKEAERDEV